MGNSVTKDDISNLQSEIKSSFDDVTSLIQTSMQQADDRFNAIENEQQKIHEDINKVFDYLDKILKKQEINQDERLVMGHQLDRLNQWVNELAKKIDYKLTT